MFKERFGEWGFRKNLKKDEVKHAVIKTRQRDGRKTAVKIRGQVFTQHRIQKAFERQYSGAELNISGEESLIRQS